MKKAESEKGRLRRAENKKLDAPRAAASYLNKGLKNLGLDSVDQTILFNKLAPIVTRQISTERSRTVTRGEGIVNRTAAKKVKTAQKKIMGGK